MLNQWLTLAGYTLVLTATAHAFEVLFTHRDGILEKRTEVDVLVKDKSEYSILYCSQ